jgi:hypothetical protein
MQSTKLIRRSNLRFLLSHRFGGRQVDLAGAVGRPADYISRLLRGVVGLGEDVARDFERRLDLPAFWLDREQESFEIAGRPEPIKLPKPELLWLEQVIQRLGTRQVPVAARETILMILDSCPRKAKQKRAELD